MVEEMAEEERRNSGAANAFLFHLHLPPPRSLSLSLAHSFNLRVARFFAAALLSSYYFLLSLLFCSNRGRTVTSAENFKLL
jgi:hypothetical protein